MSDITYILRDHQEKDPVLGSLFRSLHLFADRTAKRFFPDYPDLPHPVVAMERDRANRHGYYTSRDGYALVHRINLNPYSLRTGAEAAETLAHEMVHMLQDHVGRPCKRNYHGAEFHELMRRYGIVTDGKRGEHKEYLCTEHGARIWDAWMLENHDLHLGEFILPGMDKKKKRQLLKHLCPECGATFRSRKAIDALCMECHQPFQVVSR